MRARMWLCVVISAMAAGSRTARAADAGYSGTLTIASVLSPTSTGSVYVQGAYSVTHTCSDPGDFTYCGYFLVVTTVPQGAACRPDTLAWVQTGIYDHNQGQVPQSGPVSWSEYAVATAQPKTACLYTGDDRLVATASYTVPGTSATPTSATTQAVPPLTIAEGRASVAGVLRDKFGGRFTVHRAFRRACYRLLASTVRCRVRWDHGLWRYAGVVDMRNDPDDPESSITYSTSIRRTRLHANSTGSRPAPSPSSTCDPSYKGACLKPNVTDYDCAGGSGDGPYYVKGPITVVGDDHYGLDRDGDGIACES